MVEKSKQAILKFFIILEIQANKFCNTLSEQVFAWKNFPDSKHSGNLKNTLNMQKREKTLNNAKWKLAKGCRFLLS